MKRGTPNLDAWQLKMDSLPLRTACTFCEWEWMGSALEGRERAFRHRRELHPETPISQRRVGKNLRSFYQAKMSPEQRAEIDAERLRRARLTGVELVD